MKSMTLREAFMVIGIMTVTLTTGVLLGMGIRLIVDAIW